ncbi:MAG: hypothetical protein IH614_04840 [Desulfuromonadales bacterium]|nr:hypothetical protein [Desulfuromonadales bacterium]
MVHFNKMIRFAGLLLIISSLIFGGCARKTHLQKAKEGITPYGPDVYSVAYGGINLGEVRSIVRRAANEHCQAQGKEMLPIEESRSGLSIDLKFQCKSK